MHPPLSAFVASSILAAAACGLAAARRGASPKASRAGGLVVFVSLVGGLLVATTQASASTLPDLHGTTTVLALLLGPYLLGLHDDYTDSSPRLRLVLLLLFGYFAWGLGFRIESIMLPGGWGLTLDGFGLPATVLWVVGMTVAFDFIDGMDGLAGGLGLVACAALVAMGGPGPGPWTAAALAGALAGFLVYNRPTAKVVLGNSGSNLLGFALGIVTLQCCTSRGGRFELLPAVLVATVPILDAGLTLLRRARLGQGLFRSDRGHLHHRLLRSGLETRQALSLLLASAALSGFGAVLVQLATRVGPGAPQANLLGGTLRPGGLFAAAGLFVLLAVAWVLRASGWLRLAPLSELAHGPPERGADPASVQEAARPG